MIHVAMATTTISPNRIVDADGSVKRDFVGSPGSAGSPPPMPASTTSVATAGSVSVDMDISSGVRVLERDRDGHSAPGFVRKAVTDAWTVPPPRQQRDDTEHGDKCDHPAKCVMRVHVTTSDRIPLQRTGHAVPAAATLAELEAGDLDNVDAGLAHLPDRVR